MLAMIIKKKKKIEFMDGYANRENQQLEPANMGQEPMTTYQEQQLAKFDWINPLDKTQAKIFSNG